MVVHGAQVLLWVVQLRIIILNNLKKDKMINLIELNVSPLSNEEMIDIDGGIMIGLVIVCFAAGMACALLL